MSKRIVQLFFLPCLAMAVACSQNGMHVSDASDAEISKGQPPPGDEDSEFYPPPNDNDGMQAAPVIISPAPHFCSKLDLVGVSWPAELDLAGRSHLGLALNITGSFEGRSGWANLSNNFDGMGFSVGLLQQNLGMGTLQPLLNDVIKMREQGISFDMSEAHFQAVKSMVSQWNKEQSAKTATTTFIANTDTENPFLEDSVVLSPYDVDYDAFVSEDPLEIAPLEDRVFIKSVASANKMSVGWARKTVYKDSGKVFKSDWAENLTNMAQSKPYVSLQLKSAMKLYNQAFRYFVAFKLKTLSHFLLMFDFVVQNGGFKQRVFTDYALKLKQQPNMSDQDKVLLILQLRLRDVSARWQNDVSSRKKAIIFSEGTVHGVKRNLKTEYCFDPNAVVLTQP